MKKYLKIFSLFLLASCANNALFFQKELKEHINKNEFNIAEKLVLKEDFIQLDKNELLYLLEKGKTLFYSEKYPQALSTFDEALNVSRKLFTISLSKKLSTLIENDNADNYYGENYELSLIRYYQSLCHFLISKNGISFSKNVLIEWDSFLNSIKNPTENQSFYKDDLIAKIYGAFIHEQLESNNDKIVAKNLYEKVKEILTRYLNVLPTFNEKYKLFRDNFKNFKIENFKKIENDFITKTETQKKIITFIDEKIKQIKLNQIDNCLIVLEEGFIAEKKSQKYDIPLFNQRNIYLTQNLQNYEGDSNFLIFTLKILGLTAFSAPKIYYELPVFEEKNEKNQIKYQIENFQNSIIKKNIFEIQYPISEIAEYNFELKKSDTNLKTGLRVASKHLLALVSAYTIYNSQKKNNEFLAMSMASLAYLSSNKLIEMSENADLRSWQLLPQNFHFTSLQLPKGDYKISILKNDQLIKEISINLSNNNESKIIPIKI